MAFFSSFLFSKTFIVFLPTEYCWIGSLPLEKKNLWSESGWDAVLVWVRTAFRKKKTKMADVENGWEIRCSNLIFFLHLLEDFSFSFLLYNKSSISFLLFLGQLSCFHRCFFLSFLSIRLLFIQILLFPFLLSAFIACYCLFLFSFTQHSPCFYFHLSSATLHFLSFS